MNDEVMVARDVAAMTVHRQEALISDHCGDIIDRIRRTASRSHAERIAGEHCAAFESVCMSDVLRSAMRMNVRQWIDERWVIQ